MRAKYRKWEVESNVKMKYCNWHGFARFSIMAQAVKLVSANICLLYLVSNCLTSVFNKGKYWRRLNMKPFRARKSQKIGIWVESFYKFSIHSSVLNFFACLYQCLCLSNDSTEGSTFRYFSAEKYFACDISHLGKDIPNIIVLQVHVLQHSLKAKIFSYFRHMYIFVWKVGLNSTLR